MSPTQRRSRVKPPSASDRLSREDWIAAARKALIRAGVGEVKVDRLARDLKMTRGSFYWHFTSRADLLDALLESWARTNTDPFLRVLERDTDNPVLQYRRFVEVWIRAREFDPAYDSAMRDWARNARKVAKLVAQADAARMAALRRIFAAMGYGATEAEVRARVTYYHQVGYYALHVVESQRLRRALLPTYFRILSGAPMPRRRPADDD